MKGKKFKTGLIVVLVVVVLLGVYYTYVHFTTTPQEKAYAAAVQRVVEISDEKYNEMIKKQEESADQNADKEGYLEKIARKEEAFAQPYFDIYREKYVTKEENTYIVELPVQEMIKDQVVSEYTYKIIVEEKNGTYEVVSLEKQKIEE